MSEGAKGVESFHPQVRTRDRLSARRRVSLAARINVPTVSQSPVIARDGGLPSYGANFRDIFRRAARYVDSVLHGAKPHRIFALALVSRPIPEFCFSAQGGHGGKGATESLHLRCPLVSFPSLFSLQIRCDKPIVSIS